MKAIAIFTLVICCIGVEALPGVREKRETKNCSSLVVPRRKIYQMFLYNERVGKYGQKWGAQSTWQEARVACQDLGGDLAEPSTWEEEEKILAAIDKAKGEGGPLLYYWKFWIGVKIPIGSFGRPSTMEWVSGNQMELDSDYKPLKSDLKFQEVYGQVGCGYITSGWMMTYYPELEGIGISDCGKITAQGHVCEFDAFAFLSRLPFPVIP